MARLVILLSMVWVCQLMVFSVQSNDEMELLKCQLRELTRDYKELTRDYKELKEDTQKLTIKQLVDIKQLRMEKDEEIKQLKLENEKAVTKVREENRKEIEKLTSKGEEAINQLKKEKDNDMKKLKAKEEKDFNLLQSDLETINKYSQQQNHTLMDVTKKVSKISSYCQLLSSDVCGQCTCLDDYSRKEKYYCDCQHFPAKRDCREFREAGHKVNGMYTIHSNVGKLMHVYCDHTTDNGGWIVIQRRTDGTLNFYRDWEMYKNGFGSPHDEYWIGNDNLHLLTSQSGKGPELRIDMNDWEGKLIYAKYNTFLVDDEKRKYKLHVTGFSGNHGDSFIRHNNHYFSTYDQDNDDYKDSCSKLYRGAWWYESCHSSNLNGEYRWFDVKQPGYARGIIWRSYKAYTYSMKSVEMKIRRKD